MSKIYQIQDRGADRPAEKRFYVLEEVAEGLAVGCIVRARYGSGHPSHYGITWVGRPFETDGFQWAYHYIDADATALGAPTELTPKQERLREAQLSGMALAAIRRAGMADLDAALAVLEALRRDGWSSSRNTPGKRSSLRRAYAAGVAAGEIRLRRFRYEPVGPLKV